jgi:RNA recognition motif-containing protein
MIGNKQSNPKKTGNMVYVSNLTFSVNEQELMDFFKKNNFDPVRARLLYDNDGNSKGFGFVELATEKDVQDAITKLNGKQLQSRKIQLSIKN